MNEQFDKMIYESGLIARGCWDKFDEYDRKALNKFAELIVRECCKTLEEMHMWQSVNNQNYPSAWYDAVDQGIDNIKEHFGVEE